MSLVIPQYNEAKEINIETNQVTNRNTNLMTIDGMIYLVSFGFSSTATETLTDRLKALIYKDLQSEIAVSEILP